MHNFHSFTRRTYLCPRMLFFGLWVVGLVFGFCIAMSMPTESLSLIRSVRDSGVPAAGFLVSLLLPLAISMVVAWLRLPLIILPITFIKAFCYSFCATGLMLSFGEAGWLIYRLYLFSDSCMSVVFIWFWNRNISEITVNWKKDAILCMIVSLFVFCIDFSLVTPLLELIFNH